MLKVGSGGLGLVEGGGVEGIEGGSFILGGDEEEDDEEDDKDALPLFIAATMASPICAAVGDGGRLAIIFSISLAVAGWGKPVIIA